MNVSHASFQTASSHFSYSFVLFRKKNGQQHQAQDSYPTYDFLYVPDQDTVQQPEYAQIPDNSCKDTPPTIESNYACVLSPDIRNQHEKPQQHTSLDSPATVANTYSYVLMPEDSQQPEQLRHTTSVGARLESSKCEIGDDMRSHTYRNFVVSAKGPLEPPEAAGEHTYAAVIMQNKRKPSTVGVTTEKPSPEMLVPTPPPQTMLQPVTPTPSNGETYSQ